MKTIELKWIEDDNHTVAKNACGGLQELIDTGVFPDLTAKCEDDTLYITGEQDELDKAVMKIQKAYAKYGQIMIKEAKKEGGLRIESYDDNVQEIFDYTVKEFDKLKENKNSTDYITKLGDFQMKFKKLKEAAGKKDKATIQNYLDEISTLTENAEIKKIKPIRMKVNEGFDFKTQITPQEMYDTVIELNTKMKMNFDVSKTFNSIIVDTNPIKFYIKANKRFLWVEQGDTNVYRQKLDNGVLTKSDLVDVMSWIKECIRDYKVTDETVEENYNRQLRKQLSNPANWGIIEEGLDRETYNKKFNKVLVLYSEETGKKTDDVYDELMDNDELPELVDSPLDPYEIVDKLLYESTKINESFLSPGELKKKLQRVAARWASIKGVKFEEAYNELRKKKSVKDMLDFYTVDEIIDDLKKKKKEVDDELEEEI